MLSAEQRRPIATAWPTRPRQRSARTAEYRITSSYTWGEQFLTTAQRASPITLLASPLPRRSALDSFDADTLNNAALAPAASRDRPSINDESLNGLSSRTRPPTGQVNYLIVRNDARRHAAFYVSIDRPKDQGRRCSPVTLLASRPPLRDQLNHATTAQLAANFERTGPCSA